MPTADPSQHALRLDLFLTGSEADVADTAETERLGRDLATELRHLDALAAVEPSPAPPAPDGAKGVDVAWGSLLIRFAEVGGMASLAGILTSWLGRDRRRRLRIEIAGDVLEVDGIDAAERDRLTDWFRARIEAREGRSGKAAG